ncbi:hypothetical protein [Streptomyces sp. NPDC047928]|uniref:hypothetical protein n=1 Tax=unclassified Streptomyces TaxID=2593676 RepID=UPI00370FEA9B
MSESRDEFGNGTVDNGHSASDDLNAPNPANGAGAGERAAGEETVDARDTADAWDTADVADAADVAGGADVGDGGDVAGGAGGGDELNALDGDELALRRLLQGAVQDLRPADGALEHLRKAVPARRARKRQALVGAAAAVLLFGTGVPAFVHVADSDGTSDDRPVNAGHGEQAQGGTGDDAGEDGGNQAAGSKSGELTTGGQGGKGHQEKPQEAVAGASDGTVNGTDPSSSAPSTVPVCDAGQLGVASTSSSERDAEGKVYGTFRVANVSSDDCAVTGPGTVAFTANGAADPGRITVVRHTAGDAATGLPDPAGEAETLVLKPSSAYEVKFAWVPSETCPVNGGGTGGDSGGTSPSPSTLPDGGTSGGTADADKTGAEPQLVPADGTPAAGSVTITHTAEPGAPSASETVSHACAGTIYRTGMTPTA